MNIKFFKIHLGQSNIKLKKCFLYLERKHCTCINHIQTVEIVVFLMKIWQNCLLTNFEIWEPAYKCRTNSIKNKSLLHVLYFKLLNKLVFDFISINFLKSIKKCNKVTIKEFEIRSPFRVKIDIIAGPIQEKIKATM